MTGNVKAHFDSRAADYAEKSNRWPWALLRDRETQAFLGLLPNIKDKEVLEFGPGAGHYTRNVIACGAKRVCCVDQSANMIKSLPPKLTEGIVGDATQINIGRHFPLIISAGVLEFIRSPDALFRNARRHAMTNSILLILAPRNNFWGMLYHHYHRRNGIGISLFEEAQLGELARRAGWRQLGIRLVWPFTIIMKFSAKSLDDSLHIN